MANACTSNQYFSGQGALLLASRDVTGAALGFLPVGNVSALTLGVDTTTFEHKESCTGVRGTDLEIVQEIKVSASFTMESLSKENLALALFGSSSTVVGAPVLDEQIPLYLDKWMPLANINVSSVVVGDDALPTTTYVEGTDYQVNLAAGSIMALTGGAITDGQVVFVDYTAGGHDEVEAVETGSPPERWARFEGLNTANSDSPVVVDFYRMSMQPLKELAMITDEISQMDVEAKVLSDAFRTTGSKFFSIKK